MTALALALASLLASSLDAQTSLQERIHSDTWTTRRQVFVSLLGIEPSVYDRGGVPDVHAFVRATITPLSGPAAESRRRQLIELLEEENRFVETKAAMRRERGLAELPQAERLTEPYLNYYGDVVAAVTALRDVRSINALVYNLASGTMVTEALVALGPPAVGPVAARIASSDPLIRSAAARVLSEMLVKSSPISGNAMSRSVISQALIMAASDTNYLVRRATISGLVRLGDPEAIALVQKMAQSDPQEAPGPGGASTYPVRDVAREALSTRSSR